MNEVITLVYINFINTGLDDRIVKSATNDLPPAKTEKMVMVHDKQKGDYVRKQRVNVEQAKSGDKSHSTNDEPFSKILTPLLSKLKDSGAKVMRILMKYSENEGVNGKPDPFFYLNVNGSMWDKISIMASNIAYEGYQKFYSIARINRLLGDEDYEKSIGVTPGATHYQKYEKSLNKWEYSSIGAYTYSKWTYKLTNWLRGLTGTDSTGKPIPLPENDQELNLVKTVTKHLDSAIEKYELEKPMVTYRTVNIDTLKYLLEPGDGKFQDDGFMSTTTLPNGFDIGEAPGLTMICKIPAGKGIGAWLKPISRIPHEQEFLLARGTQFKIESLTVKYDKDKNPVNAIMEVSPIGCNPKKIEPSTEEFEYYDYDDLCAQEPEEDDDFDDGGDWGEPDDDEKFLNQLKS